MDEVNDQVPQDSQGEQNSTTDQATEEQSDTTKEVTEVKTPTYRDHLGRELTGEQLHEEYIKTQSYITQLETEKKRWEQSAQQEAQKAVSENEYLKGVDPNVREAIVQIVTPVIEDRLKAKDLEAQKKAQDEAFSRRIDEVASKYPGGNGLPKFDKVRVLAAMQDPNNTIFDPEWKFREMYWKEFIDFENKQAIKGKSGKTDTETTGSSQPRKPEGTKPASTFEEASRRALSRIGQ